MPTYEYECQKCHKHVELVQPMNNRIPPICCEDGCSIEMTPLISVSTFILKGYGWASDGYIGKKK